MPQPLFACPCDKPHHSIGAHAVHDYRNFEETAAYQSHAHDIAAVGTDRAGHRLAYYRFSGARAITERLYREMVNQRTT